MLSKQTLARAAEYRELFREAEPFPHVAIDGFLDSQVVESLHEEFPAFRPERAINEFGLVGTNCYINDIWNLGSSFKQFYDYCQSPEFLSALSDLTGIPDLIADPELRGGGTHNTLEGHELAPHLDFNLQDGLHRRLNVLIYMNKGWRLEWEGAIELFENGRDTVSSSFKRYNCEFNRCVIFETSERSWHGFRKIRLPGDQKHRSRRLISLYYYTETRPGGDDLIYHATFFCPYFPERLLDPRPLNDEERQDVLESIRLRDDLLKFYQEREMAVRKSYGYSVSEHREHARRLAMQAEDQALAAVPPEETPVEQPDPSAPSVEPDPAAAGPPDLQVQGEGRPPTPDLDALPFRFLARAVGRIFMARSRRRLRSWLGSASRLRDRVAP